MRGRSGEPAVTVRPAAPARRRPGIDHRASFVSDVQYYLQQDPRQLPSRYLYDALGSCLFEAICQLPWYPITRAETRLLAAHRRDVLAAPPIARIVELGCGSGEKLATLLGARRQALRALELHLVDVSPTALAVSARALSALDTVRIITHEEPYEAGLAEIRDRGPADGRTLVLLLGSNIGNFDPPGADEFLRLIRAALSPGDLLLLGADLVKPEAVLRLAYDDPLGVTAAFNRNLLVRINRELGGTFNLDRFAHRARWNAAASRVEMHLVSLRRQTVRVDAAGVEITLERGESIWTESSYKYRPEEISDVARRARFAPRAQWIDAADPFALTLVEAT
jgi:dimethylhistidine N-methyltransferase